MSQTDIIPIFPSRALWAWKYVALLAQRKDKNERGRDKEWRNGRVERYWEPEVAAAGKGLGRMNSRKLRGHSPIPNGQGHLSPRAERLGCRAVPCSGISIP